MRKLRRDTKGAVTVMVTLLLIPSILLSGTAVDLARLYTARSILQDANQLAANSVLTQYNALLQDLYGLYGVMADDPVLAGMLDEYIQAAVFGEDWIEKGLGTFQLFYGSNLQPVNVETPEGQHLANAEVLRRQIEDYMKFRGPVIIVEDILSLLGSMDKLKDDAEAIRKKMDIDDKLD
jgi:hypothetical protein